MKKLKTIIRIIKNVSDLLEILHLLSNQKENISYNIIMDLENQNLNLHKELTNLKTRISVYREFFKDGRTDYRPNFIAEFPANWFTHEPQRYTKFEIKDDLYIFSETKDKTK